MADVLNSPMTIISALGRAPLQGQPGGWSGKQWLIMAISTGVDMPVGIRVRDEAYYGEEETEVREDGVRYGSQGTPVEWAEEEKVIFRLSSHQDRLLDLYEQNPGFIMPAGMQ